MKTQRGDGTMPGCLSASINGTMARDDRQKAGSSMLGGPVDTRQRTEHARGRSTVNLNAIWAPPSAAN